MSYINSINNSNTDYLISGVSDIIVCGTSASTVAKTATAMDAFSLDSNLSFKIKFTNGNTASSPTLNLSNTGAKSLTTTTSNYTLVAGTVYDCYYNGTSYVLDNTVTVHTANTSNPHSVTKAQVGLGNCDNTADANKSVASAGKWTTARNFTIKDSDSTNSGIAVSVNGSGAVTLLLPPTIKASITGNCSGSSGSCTGNSATATNATTKFGGYPIQSTSIGGSATETTNYWTYVTKSKFTTDGGYIKYSNGLLIQWGNKNNTTFPIAFTNNTSFVIMQSSSQCDGKTAQITSKSSTSFGGYWQSGDGWWFAIGY